MVYISLEGEVEGIVGAEDEIIVVVSPDPNATANPVVLKGEDFKGKVAFDTTRSGGRFHHNCSRRPANVTILLLSNKEELDRVKLSIEDDFFRDEEGDYRLSSPLGLSKARSFKP